MTATHQAPVVAFTAPHPWSPAGRALCEGPSAGRCTGATHELLDALQVVWGERGEGWGSPGRWWRPPGHRPSLDNHRDAPTARRLSASRGNAFRTLSHDSCGPASPTSMEMDLAGTLTMPPESHL